MEEGTMWKYIKDHKIYKCPVGDKGQRVTYFMSHAMNTYPNSGGTAATAPRIVLRSRLREPPRDLSFWT